MARRKVAVLSLAFVAGFVDAAVALAVLQISVAHITGDTRDVGTALVHLDATGIARAGIAVATFVCGVFLGGLLMEVTARNGVRRRLAIAVCIESVLIGAALAAAAVMHLPATPPASQLLWLIGLPAGAMGLQTSAADQVHGRRVRTTYLSGMVTRFGQAAARWALWIRDAMRRPTHVRFRQALRASLRLHSADRAMLLAGIWIVWVGGVACGARAETAWGIEATAIPIGLLVLVAAADVRRPFEFPPPLPPEPDPRAAL